MRKGKVVVFTKPGTPLQIREELSPPPASNEVVVRLLIAGVCGSDAHRLLGDLPTPPQPVCFGHEAVGVVEALGDDITTDRAGAPLAVGDRVYWLPATPCGHCEACELSSPMSCKSVNWPVPAGGPNAAAFREFATISDRSIMYKIPEGTSSEAVITLGCAMPTALRGFGKLGDIGPDVVIQGAGPVGLASILLSSLAGVRNIIVIAKSERRLRFARTFGATETISISSTTASKRRERVLELTNGRGASVVIEAAGQPDAFPEGFGLLGMNGRYLILGLYSGNAITPIDPVRINNLNLQIIGSLGIEAECYLRTVQIATEYGDRLRFADLITHRFALENVEEAIGTVARGESVKTVVTPD